MLAEAASHYLDSGERNRLFIAIGIGEAFSAIGLALQAIVRADCTVERDVAARLEAWLTAYIGHDDEQQLRRWIQRAAVAARSRHVPSSCSRSA